LDRSSWSLHGAGQRTVSPEAFKIALSADPSEPLGIRKVKKAPESEDPGAVMVEVRGQILRPFRIGPDYAFIPMGCGAS
jgi:hypothetical protein